MTETVLADEQNLVDELENDVELLDDEDIDDQTNAKLTQYELELARIKKENEQLAKYKERYKANKKAEASKPVAKTTDIDIDSLVERKLADIQARDKIKAEYGEESMTEFSKLKEQHPTLSWEQVIKLSPITNDPARVISPEATASAGRADLSAYRKSNTITTEALSKLAQSDYNFARAQIKKGELKLVG